MSTRTVARYCRIGLLPSVLIGNQFRIRQTDLGRFIAARTYAPPEFGSRKEEIGSDERIRILELARSNQ
jgi:hypothetical protein